MSSTAIAVTVTVFQIVTLFSGTYIGPDFQMSVSTKNDGAIIWADGSVGTFRLTRAERNSIGSIATGTVNFSTDKTKMSPGDTVSIIIGHRNDALVIKRPNGTYRWSAPICSQGYNLEAGQQLTPDEHGQCLVTPVLP